MRLQEMILARKSKPPTGVEEIPNELSPGRRSRDPVVYVPGLCRLHVASASMRRRLRNLDFEVYSVRLPNFAVGDIRKGARVLLDTMEELRILLGVKRLSVVGQGLGGLVGRYMAEQINGGHYLSRLTMLGSPNYGSSTMYIFPVFTGARQMLPGSAFLEGLNENYENMLGAGVKFPYVSIYSPYDVAVTPWTNCRLEGARNLRVSWFCTHMGLVRSRSVLRVLAELLEGEGSGEHAGVEEEKNALLRDLSKSLERNPQDEGSLYRRGMLLLEHGYFNLAIRDLTRLIKMRPDFAEAYLLRGKALRRKITYDENPLYNRAIRDFNQVIKLQPGWAEPYYQRGICYALLNSWSEAVDNWDRALILNRDLYPAYLSRGLGRRRKGDMAGAVEDFREVLRIQPDEPEALRFLSELGT